jgi:hypothetical protein
MFYLCLIFKMVKKIKFKIIHLKNLFRANFIIEMVKILKLKFNKFENVFYIIL